MIDKSLDVESIEQAKQKVSDIKVFGDGDTFTLLCKASSESQGFMKSTKVANVEDGCIVQVTTQQKNSDGSYAVAEAVTYVPGINIDKQCIPPKLTSIYKNSQLTPVGLRSHYENTPEDIERREESERNYNRREYLSVLIELQKNGHTVHDEINECLRDLKKAYGL